METRTRDLLKAADYYDFDADEEDDLTACRPPLAPPVEPSPPRPARWWDWPLLLAGFLFAILAALCLAAVVLFFVWGAVDCMQRPGSECGGNQPERSERYDPYVRDWR